MNEQLTETHMKQDNFDEVFTNLKALENSDSVIIEKAYNYHANESAEEKREANVIAMDFKQNYFMAISGKKYRPRKLKRP